MSLNFPSNVPNEGKSSSTVVRRNVIPQIPVGGQFITRVIVCTAHGKRRVVAKLVNPSAETFSRFSPSYIEIAGGSLGCAVI
jgi:hypothetical protein